MKAKDVEIGTTIKNPLLRGGTIKGTIIGTKLSDGDEVVAVEWSDGSLTKANINDLDIIDTALERDYEKIKELVATASKALTEASLLAQENGRLLSALQYSDEDFAFDILFGALESAGWATSSMAC
jgi:hypothetical protein